MKWATLAGWLLYCVATAGAAAEAKEDLLRTCSLTAEGGDEFCLEVPWDWSSETGAATNAAGPTLRLSNPDRSSQLLISMPTPTASSPGDTPERLEKLLRDSMQTPALGAGEPRWNVLSFRSRHGFGLYASSTDPRYLTADPPAGQYRFSTVFVMNCQERVVTARFLSNEEPLDSADLAVLLLKNLRKTGIPPRREASAKSLLIGK